jgi:hypothetical protein
VKRAVLVSGFAAFALVLAMPACASALALLPGSEGFDANVYTDVSADSKGGEPVKQAGSHPGSLSFSVNFETEGGGPFTEGSLRNLGLEMPAGLIEIPTALSPEAPIKSGECSQIDFATPRSSPFEKSLSGESCPDRTQVGVVTVRSAVGGGETRTFGLFNLAPPRGAPTELGFNPYGHPIVFVPSLRQADGEYGVNLRAKDVSSALDVSGLTVTIWGTPWGLLGPKELVKEEPEEHIKWYFEPVNHDSERGNCLNEKNTAAFFGQRGGILTIVEETESGTSTATEQIHGTCTVYNPVAELPRPYLTLPTSCEEPLDFSLEVESWNPSEAQPDPRRTFGKQTLGGCDALRFEPSASAQLSNPRASSPSGYAFDIAADTRGLFEPTRLIPTPLRKAVVTLPQGVTINPSVGAGLDICTKAQYEGETASSPVGAGCPTESKIGDFGVRSPILPGPVSGAIYLAAPYDNPFGSLLAVYLVAKSVQRGILVKVAGKLEPDPRTGSLTAIFDRLPQLPYSTLSIHFREGQRSPLATSAACGAISTEVNFTPWRDPNLVTHASLPAAITAGSGGGPCPSGLAPFAPGVVGGSLNSQAGWYTPFYLHLSRKVTEQEITSYSAQFPPGLLAKIAGIPYCPDAAIEAARRTSGIAERDHPSCPAASLIGHTYSGYGVGSVLAYSPGNVYLAGPYRGSSLSVVAIDPALVGPFDLGTVIVRSAVRIDPTTAQASIDATGTDPIPHIIDGIPIHLRDVRAYIDRPDFTVNPTSCEKFSVASAMNGAGLRFGDISDDTLVTGTSSFQAFDCASLGFRPRIAMKMLGRFRRGGFPSLRIVVRPHPGDTNIASSQVTLPPSIFFDQSRIKTVCTAAQFAARNCPRGSIYGHVQAFTPLLEQPMEGPAILRTSSHTLPDLVFVLRGRGMEVDVAGRIDSRNGGIRGTFPTIPDAPVSKFVLRMNAGSHGVLVNAENLCKRTQLATARFLGHANRGWRLHPEMKAQCKK